MKDQDYSTELIVGASVSEVFNCINNVTQWWTDDLTGSSENLHDEFTVQFGDVHISTQKIIERIENKKIVWLVTDSKINFVTVKDEWTNTKIVFEISIQNNQTHIQFTHVGLLPSIQCYNGCSQGWDYYINGSLYKLLTEGKGTPGL